MTIKEVEKKLNITRANIRFYEKEGLIKPSRSDNKYRDYSEDDLKKLEKILLFRKCNVSIENIRKILNGEKSIEDVFEKQIFLIESEVKQLEGAKILCKKLAKEKSSIDNIDIKKYTNIIENEEQKGNKFYNIAGDYIFATEKLYQSIIENKEFKGGDKMKKGIKVGVYVASAILLFLCLILFDYIFTNGIYWTDAIIFTAIFMVADVIGVKKWIESKNGKKLTKKENTNHFLLIILAMIGALLCYYTIEEIYTINYSVNDNILEMSVKNSLINIANEEYVNDNNYIYAEGHKILDYEVKDDEIYVYVVTNYGLFMKNNNELSSVNSKKGTLTMIYSKEKSNSGVYELKKYEKDRIPNRLKNKVNVNYEDDYFKNQLNNYINN